MPASALQASLTRTILLQCLRGRRPLRKVRVTDYCETPTTRQMPKGGQAGELGRRLLATAVAAAMLSSSCSFSVFCRHTLPLGRGSAALHTQRRGVLTTAPAASRRADYRVMMCAGEPAPDMKSGVEATIAKKTKKPAVRERPAHVEAGQRWNTTVSLESLRALQANFALERNWDQHHTPRNLALAMVGEVIMSTTI